MRLFVHTGSPSVFVPLTVRVGRVPRGLGDPTETGHTMRRMAELNDILMALFQKFDVLVSPAMPYDPFTAAGPQLSAADGEEFDQPWHVAGRRLAGGGRMRRERSVHVILTLARRDARGGTRPAVARLHVPVQL